MTLTFVDRAGRPIQGNSWSARGRSVSRTATTAAVVFVRDDAVA
jgi:hypothetical protein